MLTKYPRAFFGVSIMAIAAGLLLLSGCLTPSQWANVKTKADDVQYVASPTPVATPATNPTDQANLDAARAAAQAAAQSTPYGTLAALLTALGAAGVSAVAGHFVGSASATAKATTNTNSLLTEMAHGVAAYLPGAWNAPLTAALQTAGLHDVANPMPTPTAPVLPNIAPVVPAQAA